MQIKLLVNKDNFIQSPHITDANIEVTCELSESDIAKLDLVRFGYAWQLNSQHNAITEVPVTTKEAIRFNRSANCFKLIDNKSTLWYQKLTNEQKAELDAWYQAWLDATVTKIIPTKPAWLK